MSRYIDADELEKELKWEVMFDYDADYQYVTKYDIDNTPTADVAEVKRGRWIDPEDITCYKCSVCGKYAIQEYGLNAPIFWHYCPNCGAKMDEVDNDVSV